MQEDTINTKKKMGNSKKKLQLICSTLYTVKIYVL